VSATGLKSKKCQFFTPYLGNSQKIKYPNVLNGSEAHRSITNDALHCRSAHPTKMVGYFCVLPYFVHIP
jgi:hypothetical protein